MGILLIGRTLAGYRRSGFLFCADALIVCSILFCLVSGRFALSIQVKIFFLTELLGSDSEVVIRFNALLAGGCSRG
jgi:hypothetical protein